MDQPWLERDWWKRIAIVGTAPSWKECPWDDPTLRILGLNDLYVLGIPRIDAWYELHPLGEMWFRPKDRTVLDAGRVPPGKYVRPQGHLEWLQAQAQRVPVWLQDVPEGWPPNCARFPIEPVLAFLFGYVASGPSMMIAHAILNGVEELHIYGIHLQTQNEYIEQRPNFEAVLGRFLGCDQLLFSTEHEGRTRRYVGTNGRTVVLPAASPILKHDRIYGYQPRPAVPEALIELRRRLAAVRARHQHLCQALIDRRWYHANPWRVRALQDEQWRIEAKMLDLQEQIGRFKPTSSSHAQTIPVLAA